MRTRSHMAYLRHMVYRKIQTRSEEAVETPMSAA